VGHAAFRSLLGIGVLIFGEKQKWREIAPGAAAMLAGAVLLSLAA
jgi:hypothetical protein